MQGGAHHLAEHVAAQQGLPVDLEQAVPGRGNGDLALHHLVGEARSRPGKSGRQQPGRLVFMDLVGTKFENVQIVLAEAPQVFYILRPDDIPFF